MSNNKTYVRKVLAQSRKFKIGDVITSYYKGYHVVTNIISRPAYTPLIEHRTILDSHFNPVKSNSIKTCDVAWCRILDRETIEKERVNQIEHFQAGYDILLKNLK